MTWFVEVYINCNSEVYVTCVWGEARDLKWKEESVT